MNENGIRSTNAYKAVLAEMRSWEGQLELRGDDGPDIFGRPRRWTMSAYEYWAASIAARIIEANGGRDIGEPEPAPEPAPPPGSLSAREIFDQAVKDRLDEDPNADHPVQFTIKSHGDTITKCSLCFALVVQSDHQNHRFWHDVHVAVHNQIAERADRYVPPPRYGGR